MTTDEAHDLLDHARAGSDVPAERITEALAATGDLASTWRAGRTSVGQQVLLACLDTIADAEAGREVDALKLATARWTVKNNRMPTREEVARMCLGDHVSNRVALNAVAEARKTPARFPSDGAPWA